MALLALEVVRSLTAFAAIGARAAPDSGTIAAAIRSSRRFMSRTLTARTRAGSQGNPRADAPGPPWVIRSRFARYGGTSARRGGQRCPGTEEPHDAETEP
ncbi:hypothetical protein GCM10010443_04430 [Actinoplanes cyaneus]